MLDLDEPGGGTIKPANNEKDNISIKSENGANSLPGRGKPGKQKRGLFGTVFSKKVCGNNILSEVFRVILGIYKDGGFLLLLYLS